MQVIPFFLDLKGKFMKIYQGPHQFLCQRLLTHKPQNLSWKIKHELSAYFPVLLFIRQDTGGQNGKTFSWLKNLCRVHRVFPDPMDPINMECANSIPLNHCRHFQDVFFSECNCNSSTEAIILKAMSFSLKLGKAALNYGFRRCFVSRRIIQKGKILPLI